MPNLLVSALCICATDWIRPGGCRRPDAGILRAPVGKGLFEIRRAREGTVPNIFTDGIQAVPGQSMGPRAHAETRWLCPHDFNRAGARRITLCLRAGRPV